jgi:sugar phosphate isomerase/epimerase
MAFGNLLSALAAQIFILRTLRHESAAFLFIDGVSCLITRCRAVQPTSAIRIRTSSICLHLVESGLLRKVINTCTRFIQNDSGGIAMPVFSLNTWSLERYLGPLRMIEWNDGKKEHTLKVDSQPETMTLLELVARLGAEGYGAVEIPYAQFQETTDETLDQLRSTARECGVEMASLLLDYGDLSSADPLRRSADMAWYKRWIEIAAKAGFRRVRIAAGESLPEDRAALIRASEGLMEASGYAEKLGVGVVTENLGSLLSNSDNCQHLLELCRGQVGFTADFGNFKEDKYRQLAEVMTAAETVHAKAVHTEDGRFDEADFRRCIELCVDAGFKGPYSLTYLGGGDNLKSLKAMRLIADGVLTKPISDGYANRW